MGLTSKEEKLDIRDPHYLERARGKGWEELVMCLSVRRG